ncbi:MAG: hypothetical protein KAT71_00305, partial [Gammaproteobacteria bacterium]|nr:hypothetical protein [Gammaproteobacteria bacterium]
LLVVGLLLLGIFRGFIYSPTISHLSKNSITATFGKNIPLSIYRLFETLGRIIGPIVLIQLLIFCNYTTLSFAIVGGGFILIAILFIGFNRFFAA